jgi:hypothetical protein
VFRINVMPHLWRRPLDLGLAVSNKHGATRLKQCSGSERHAGDAEPLPRLNSRKRWPAHTNSHKLSELTPTDSGRKHERYSTQPKRGIAQCRVRSLPSAAMLNLMPVPTKKNGKNQPTHTALIFSRSDLPMHDYCAGIVISGSLSSPVSAVIVNKNMIAVNARFVRQSLSSTQNH